MRRIIIVIAALLISACSVLPAESENPCPPNQRHLGGNVCDATFDFPSRF